MAGAGGGGAGGTLTAQLDNIVPGGLDQSQALKAIFAVHFALTSVALAGGWTPHAYMFYNGFLLAGLLWALTAHDPDTPLTKCLFISAFAAVMDLLIMISSYNSMGGFSGWRGLSLAACILNFVCRLPAAALLWRFRQQLGRQVYGGYAAPGGGGGQQVHNMPPQSAASTWDRRSAAPGYSYEMPPAAARPPAGDAKPLPP